MIGLPFLSRNKKTSNKFIAVSINSNDIKCVAFYHEDGRNLKIVGSGEQLLEAGSVRAGNISDIGNVTETLELAVTQACENSEGINDIIVGVSGDLCLGLTTTVRLKKGAKTKFKKDDIESLVNKINETSYMQAMNEYLQNTGNTDIDLEIITSSNVYTMVDNQKTPNPLDMKGSLLEISTFNAYTPYYHIDTLNQVAKNSKLNILAIGSELYALVEELKFSEEGLEDFIIIDISDDSTNVAIVFGGGIIATRSMYIGYNHFIEGIAEKMGLSFQEASKFLQAYVNNSITQSEETVVQNAIEEIVEIWLEGIQILFNEFSGVKTFASKIFLTGIGIDIKDLNNAIVNEGWIKSIPFKEPPEYKTVGFMDLVNISDSTGVTTGSEWINTAALGSIFVEMMEEKQ